MLRDLAPSRTYNAHMLQYLRQIYTKVLMRQSSKPKTLGAELHFFFTALASYGKLLIFLKGAFRYKRAFKHGDIQIVSFSDPPLVWSVFHWLFIHPDNSLNSRWSTMESALVWLGSFASAYVLIFQEINTAVCNKFGPKIQHCVYYTNCLKIRRIICLGELNIILR